MAQFDVYINPVPAARQELPYVVQIQNNLFDALPTRFVIPLQRTRFISENFPHRLSVKVSVAGEDLFIAAHLAGSVQSKSLKKPVAQMQEYQSIFSDALDAVQSGV